MSAVWCRQPNELSFRRRKNWLERTAQVDCQATTETGFMNNRSVETCVFYCSNYLQAESFADLDRELEGGAVKTIGLPCSGKVDVPYLIKAFETGADGVVIVTCKKKECRHIEGNLRANRRAEAVESLLEEIGMGGGRMAVVECEKDGVERAIVEIKRFIERVRNLPRGSARSGAVETKEATVA
jgi:coenzyme F420-reducing hydrogenase delta subunit